MKGIRRDSPRELVVVFVPQYVVGHWWENVLHNQSALRLRARLQFQPGVMITTVPWQLESSVGRDDRDGDGRGPAPGDLRRGLTDDRPTRRRMADRAPCRTGRRGRPAPGSRSTAAAAGPAPSSR